MNTNTNPNMNPNTNIKMNMDMTMNISNETKYEIFYKNVMKFMQSLLGYKYQKDFVAEVTHIFNHLNKD